MNFKPTNISGLFVAETKKIGDDRGSFMRLFCNDSAQKEVNTNYNIQQINLSHTVKKGTVRGMHYQNSPTPENKIVHCIQGKIFDVAVDIRQNSPTFLQHFSIELSAENNLALFIPPGCAHGFQALTDDCKMIYLHTSSYSPAHEGGLRYDDPALKINWPLPAENLSERDISFKNINQDFKGLSL